MERGQDTVETTIVTAQHCVPVIAGAPSSDVRSLRRDRSPAANGGRSFEVGRSVVEVEGRPDSVSYDPATGRLSVTAGGVVVRVRPRAP